MSNETNKRRCCEARLSDGTEDNNKRAFEVGLALIETSLLLIREQLVPLMKEYPDLTLPDPPPPSETCGKPAIEYVEHRDAKVWLCADHFDEYSKNPLLTEMEDVLDESLEDEPERVESEGTEEASN